MPYTDRTRFESVFPSIVDDALTLAKSYKTPSQSITWIKKNLEHNVLGGKYTRGFTVINTYIHTLNRPLTENEYAQAARLGWMIELLHSSFLVCDDMEDGDTVRRNKPSWHAMPGVGLIGINDASILQSVIFIVLKRHFRQYPFYVDLVELFHQTAFETEMGQMVDLISAGGKIGVEEMSVERGEVISVCKVAYYSVYAPIALGLYLGGVASEGSLGVVMRIAVKLGRVFQDHDDFEDCFGEVRVGRERGRDIRDGKCTWLVTRALDRVNLEQEGCLRENYGHMDEGKVRAVQGLYEGLGLRELFAEYEDAMFRGIRRDIDDIDESLGVKRVIFREFIDSNCRGR